MPRKRPDGTRAPNLAASVYFGKDGRWHGRVTMGTRDDGRPDRRHVTAKTEAEVLKKVRALENQRDSGHVTRPGRKWTVEKWLMHWLDTIAAVSVTENTLEGYRVAVRTHLVPGVGAHRLGRLEPEHLERLYAKMQRNGSSAGTAHQAHRTIRTALNHAVRRGHLAANPATLAQAPRLDEYEIEPYTVDEVQRLLSEASNRRNSARWAIALALGLRQGEVLGLRWSDIDLDTGTLWVRRSRLRPRYEHGCEGNPCGRTHAGYCPQRTKTRADTGETKSRAGRRRIGLPAQLVDLIRVHREEQVAERDVARQLWRDGGWVFATPTGGPINPNTDYREWKALVVRAGLRDGRLHDARHTAATVLLILGVPDRATQALMGWSDSSMAKRYQHVTNRIRSDIADQVGGLLWAGSAQPDDTRPDDEGEGQAGVRVPA